MKNVIIGNILALISSLLLVYSGMLKRKNKILVFQSMHLGVSAISNLFLGGITGAIINMISLLRNILCYKNKLRLKERVAIILLSIILSLSFNNMGIIGILPLLSIILYTWFMNIQDVKKFKLLIIVTMILWCIYNIIIKSYASAIFNLMNIIANLVTI